VTYSDIPRIIGETGMSQSREVQDLLSLLSDAVDRTVASPGSSHCWLNLMGLTRRISSKGLVDQIEAALCSRISRDGLPAFYRAIFLDLATGDARHIAEAGAILATLAPRDPDRMTAFHFRTWQRALMYAADRGAYIRGVKNANLPALARLLDETLMSRKPRLPVPRQISDIGKAAVIAPQLLTVRHPPTLMALDQAGVLMQLGLTVGLFSCQEQSGPEFDYLLGARTTPPEEKPNFEQWLRLARKGTRIHTGDTRFSIGRRWADMLKSIAEFDPVVVMFVGLHSPLIRPLYDVRPVLGLGTNSIPPMVNADVWLTAEHASSNGAAWAWGPELSGGLSWYHPYRVRRKSAGSAGPVAPIDIEDGRVVMISVGNLLAQRIAGAWADRMVALLGAHPELVWILLGGKGELPGALSGVRPGQLRLLPHSPNVPEILRRSSIYVNPPSMGGGFAVAEAMAEGLPVVTFSGSDGGDKVGIEAVHTDDEYFSRLSELIASEQIRKERGGRMRALFDQTLDLANSGASLLSACQAAVDGYHRRISLLPS
jgi:glycosyltransferase involved in cell wall biosynthesis